MNDSFFTINLGQLLTIAGMVGAVVWQAFKLGGVNQSQNAVIVLRLDHIDGGMREFKSRMDELAAAVGHWAEMSTQLAVQEQRLQALERRYNGQPEKRKAAR